MKINKLANQEELTLALEGRLDTTTAPELEACTQDLAEVKSLILDFTSLDYISSAGLRVLLAMQKIMNKQGKMVVKNINENIAEVFEVTGFDSILTVE